MTLLSALGFVVLFSLFSWQLFLKFRKSWMFRLGEQLYFLLPGQTLVGRQLPWLISLLGCLLLSFAVFQKGLGVLGTTTIATASWILNLICLATLYTRMVILRPTNISFPFRFAISFERIKALKLTDDTIHFKLPMRNWKFKLSSINQKHEVHTVFAFMESLKMMASLHDIPVSEQ